MKNFKTFFFTFHSKKITFLVVYRIYKFHRQYECLTNWIENERIKKTTNYIERKSINTVPFPHANAHLNRIQQL